MCILDEFTSWAAIERHWLIALPGDELLMILGAVFFDYETGNHRFAAEGVLLGLGLYYAFFVFRGDVGLEFRDRRMRNNIELICLDVMFLTLQV